MKIYHSKIRHRREIGGFTRWKVRLQIEFIKKYVYLDPLHDEMSQVGDDLQGYSTLKLNEKPDVKDFSRLGELYLGRLDYEMSQCVKCLTWCSGSNDDLTSNSARCTDIQSHCLAKFRKFGNYFKNSPLEKEGGGVKLKLFVRIRKDRVIRSVPIKIVFRSTIRAHYDQLSARRMTLLTNLPLECW